MTDYVVRDTQLTSVANAIRTKGGTSDPLSFPDGFVSAVQAFPAAVTLDSLSVTENGVYTPSSGHAFSEVTVNVSGGGGDTDVEDALITRTISGSYYNSRVTRVSNYAFYQCSLLTAAEFPACTSIGISAFTACFGLLTVSFPMCTRIDSYAFANCWSFQTAYFPMCVLISTAAFASCSSLAAVSFPVCETISNSAFQYCRNLTSGNFPMCKTINNSAFLGCSGLVTLSFPMLSSIIGSYAFKSCYRLLSLYLLGSVVPKIQSAGILESTPIRGYTSYTEGVKGSIYVRQSLLTSFRGTQYWTIYSSAFVGLTDEEIAALDAQEGA